MTHIESVAVTAQATFGRDGAMFEGLLDFVAQLSVVLWGLVILTTVIRFVGIRIYRRGAARTALVETAAPSAAVPAAAVPTTAVPTTAVPTTAAVIDLVQLAAGQLTDVVTNATYYEVLQPAEAPVAVAASVLVPRRAPRNRRAEPRSAAHLPALSAEA
jgi:hypothetical protein